MCPDCTEDSEWDGRGGDGDDDDRPDQVTEQQASGGLRRSKRSVRKPSVQTETKYIELMVVNDNDMVSAKGSWLPDDCSVYCLTTYPMVCPILLLIYCLKFQCYNQ